MTGDRLPRRTSRGRPLPRTPPPLTILPIRVSPEGWLSWAERRVPCALGRGGVRVDKREGDGATPVGRFALRRALYRHDREPRPTTGLPIRALHPDDGWCDAPADSAYNQPVTLPYPASHERLWRDDAVYDLIVVIGHNDSPVVPGLGSAIFLHLAHSDYRPTEGCIALARPHLIDLLTFCTKGSMILVAS